jgi:hypothetical protein
MTASFFNGSEAEGVAAVAELDDVAGAVAPAGSVEVDEAATSLAGAAGPFAGASKAAISTDSL